MLLLVGSACGDAAPPLDGSAEDDASIDAPMRDGELPDGGAADAPAPSDGAVDLDGGSGTDSGRPPTGITPQLFDFRVAAADPSCIGFESTLPITASTTTGFIVAGKTVDGITVGADGMTGHCLSVSEPFDYWDNHAIRYQGGSDVGVYEFDLQNIANDMPEPRAGADRYVSADASGGGDGTMGREWTLVQAGEEAVAGETVHVRAGDYGNVNFIVRNSGTADRPIRFVGYRTTPGDDPDLRWSYPDRTTFDASVMPLLDGEDEFDGRGVETQGSYIIIENFQVQRYQTLFLVQRPASFVEIRNVLVNRGNYGFQQTQGVGQNVRVLDSVVYQTHTTGIRIYGSHNRIERNRIYDDRVNGEDVGGVNPSYSMDYYLNFNGVNNIVRDCHLERIEQPECFGLGGQCDHSGHGLSIKANGGPTSEHNLAENVDVVGIGLSIEVWHPDVAFNVFRNIRVWRRDTTAKNKCGGIDVLQGAHDNVFDNITVTDTRFGIFFEGPGNDDNLIRNSVFRGNSAAMRMDDPVRGNRFVNCVFDDNGRMVTGGDSAAANPVVNSQVTGTPTAGTIDALSFGHCNFWGSFAAPAGSGNIAVDPSYANAADGDFHLTDSSPAAVTEGGTTDPSCRYDRDGVERTEPYSVGAYEAD